MRIEISAHAVLTTEHAASSDGLPVLVIAGQPYGAADRLPAGWRGLRGGEAVVLWAALAERAAAERALARAYCAQWPEGPQIPLEPGAVLGARGRGASKRRGGKTRAEVSVYMSELAKRRRPR